MSDNLKIGKFIAELRKQKGLTQTALGELLNLSNRAVSKWETGEGLPDVSVLPLLADVLGVTVDELLRGEKSKETSVKVEEVANKKNLLNIFNISFIVSIFACAFGALLGGFNNVYCFLHFRTLFYTHWEIIFDAVSFAAIVFGNLLFYVSAVRLELRFTKPEIIALSFRRALSLFILSCVFLLSFLMRVVNRYVRLDITVAAAAALLGVLVIAGSIVASKKLGRKYSIEKIY